MPEVYFFKTVLNVYSSYNFVVVGREKKCSYMTMELNLYFTGYIDHILGLVW